MRISLILATIALLIANISCTGQKAGNPAQQERKEPKMERVKVVIDENLIATKDAFSIIDPVWFTANIYGSYREYETSLAKFSQAQRLMLAASWYQAEVNNGGHDQFYFNSTGIVWEDAQKAFTDIGVPEVAEIIAESAKRMGGRPSFDREERMRYLEEKKPDFSDLDDRFYKLNIDIDAKMLNYIRKRPKDFLFNGEIERPKL